MAAELIVATVGGFLAAIVLAPAAGTDPGHGLVVLLFVGSSVHVATTMGLFGFAEVRRHAAEHPRRYIVAPLMLCAAGAATAALATTHVVAIALLGYYAWQFFHYQKQNLGLAALTARASRVSGPSSIERRALLATGITGIVRLILDPALLQLPLTGSAGDRHSPLFLTTAAVFVACAATGTIALIRRAAGQRPAGLVVIYQLGLWFPLPIFAFASPYQAVAGMTVAHGLQYIVLVSRVVAGPSHRRITSQVGNLLAAASVFGLGLSLASHLHGGNPLARLGYGAYLGIVMSHFVVDAGLWRMRDAFPRHFLSQRLPAIAGVVPAGGLP